MKALVYRRGGLGDTLLLFPILENLKKMGYKVIFLGNSDYLDIARHCGLADEIYSSEFLSLFLSQPFDKKIIISLEGNLNPFPCKRIWLPIYYLETLHFPLEFSKKLTLNLAPLYNTSSKLAILHPGSGSPKKNPSLSLFEKIENFLQKRGYQTIYFAGPAERTFLRSKKPLFSSNNIIEVIRFLLSGSLYIGNDSGISHLASYLGLRAILFYGPSDEIIFRPIGERVTIITLPLSCRPCFPRVCEERKCLQEEELWQAFQENFTL